MSKQYRDARQLIGLLAMEAAHAARWDCTLARVALDVVVWEPDRRRRDLNFGKAFKDAITAAAVVWGDDSQVRDERWRFDPADEPRHKERAGAWVCITKE